MLCVARCQPLPKEPLSDNATRGSIQGSVRGLICGLARGLGTGLAITGLGYTLEPKFAGFEFVRGLLDRGLGQGLALGLGQGLTLGLGQGLTLRERGATKLPTLELGLSLEFGLLS